VGRRLEGPTIPDGGDVTKRWTVHQGDVREVLPTLEAQSFDAVLTDPPYELTSGGKTGFMGKAWDGSGVAFEVAVWAAVLAALRPGAHMLAFGGTRTFHRMTCAIEDGGFEVRDCCCYLYGSGFPKSLDISKAIDKSAGAARGADHLPRGTRALVDGESYRGGVGTKQTQVDVPVPAPATDAAKVWDGMGTALKPAWEPCVLCRVPLDGTVAGNAQKHGVGGIAIDACRIGYVSDEDQAAAARAAQRLCQDQNAGRTVYHDFNNGPASLQPYLDKQTLGRWPANVLLSHTDECRFVGAQDSGETATQTRSSDKVVSQNRAMGGPNYDTSVVGSAHRPPVEIWDCVPDCPVRMLDEQSGNRPGMSGGGQHRADYPGGMFGGINSTATARGDFGGASRFFFTSKASRSDRDHGLISGPTLSVRELLGRDPDSPGAKSPRAGAGGRHRNPHPTVKPTDLIEYLAKLILPPRGIGRPRRLLVPFAGSGSEMIGALRAGWDEVVGIELEYADIARERLTHADVAHQPDLFGGTAA